MPPFLQLLNTKQVHVGDNQSLTLTKYLGFPSKCVAIRALHEPNHLVLHSDLLHEQISSESIHQLLTDNWRREYINNDSKNYGAKQCENVFFYCVTRNSTMDNKHQFDGYHWRPTKSFPVLDNTIIVKYYEHLKRVGKIETSSYVEFRKREYFLQQKQCNEEFYRGVVVYFRPPQVPCAKLELPHGGCTVSDAKRSRKTHKEMQKLKKGLFTTKLRKTLKQIADTIVNGVQPNNTHQISNLYYQQ